MNNICLLSGFVYIFFNNFRYMLFEKSCQYGGVKLFFIGSNHFIVLINDFKTAIFYKLMCFLACFHLFCFMICEIIAIITLRVIALPACLYSCESDMPVFLLFQYILSGISLRRKHSNGGSS